MSPAPPQGWVLEGSDQQIEAAPDPLASVVSTASREGIPSLMGARGQVGQRPEGQAWAEAAGIAGAPEGLSPGPHPEEQRSECEPQAAEAPAGSERTGREAWRALAHPPGIILSCFSSHRTAGQPVAVSVSDRLSSGAQ